MLHSAWVYIITNKNNTTLYVGVTTDLSTRLWEHRNKQDPNSFSARYNLNKLVYYEGFNTIMEAIDREKYMKGKSRQWKINVINLKNREWKDLTETASTLV